MSNVFATKNVFVVDDTAFMRATLIKILIELGFEKTRIYQFENARGAIDSLRSSVTADIILSDWNMPQMRGIDFLKNVRGSADAIKNLPFVLITTDSDKEKVIEAIKYRLNGYLIKPVDQEKLREVLEGIFPSEDE